MSNVIRSDLSLYESDPECNIDNFIYRAALIHAFLSSVDNYDVMSYDIIYNELHSNYFYGTFLNSVEHMSYLFLEHVVRWSYIEFTDNILLNEVVPDLLFNCWKKYVHLMKLDNGEVDEDLQLEKFIEDIQALNITS